MSTVHQEMTRQAKGAKYSKTWQKTAHKPLPTATSCKDKSALRRNKPSKLKEAAVEVATCMERHKGLVINIAKKVAYTYHLDHDKREELVAFGQRGLLEAFRRFDSSRKNAFSTFAYYRIRGAIIDGARSMQWVRRRRAVQAKADQVYCEIQASNFQDRPVIVARQSKTLASDFDDIISSAGISFLLTENAAETSIDHSDYGRDPEAKAIASQDQSRMKVALKTLPFDEQKIIEMSFFQDKNLDEIGAVLGCSRSWVCRKRSSILKKLRKRLLAPPLPYSSSKNTS